MDSFMSIDSKMLIHRQISCNIKISIIYRRKMETRIAQYILQKLNI